MKLQSYSKRRKFQQSFTASLIVVNTGVHESCGQADLKLISFRVRPLRIPGRQCAHLTHVVLYRVLGSPQGRCWPTPTVNTMIRHATVDLKSSSASSPLLRAVPAHIMLDPGSFGSIGERLADGDLISPCKGIDEGFVRVNEQAGNEFLVFEGAFNDGDIFESVELTGDGVILLIDVCPHLIPYRRGDSTH